MLLAVSKERSSLLFASKYSPRDGVDRFGIRRHELASTVASEVGNLLGTRQLLPQFLPVRCRQEELNKGLCRSDCWTFLQLDKLGTYFLEYESIPRTPSEHLIITSNAIDCWLACYRPPALLVQLEQLLLNRFALVVETFFAPRNGLKLSFNVPNE